MVIPTTQFLVWQSDNGDLSVFLAEDSSAVCDAFQKEFQAAPSSMLVVRLAGALMRSGRTDTATKMLIEWVSQHEDDTGVTQQLSEILLATQRYSDAAVYLE